MSVAAAPLPMLLAELEAVCVERLSPSFVRVELGGPELADLGIDGPSYDQRIKLVLPHGDGPLPEVAGADETWLSTWSAQPVEERGHMRTYTVRAVRGSGARTRLVVDVVVHEDGLAGPGARWALAARPGSRVVVLAPRRGVPFGGIEFEPVPGARQLLVGDESAVPAVARILEDLPATATGAAFLEVPDALDFQDLVVPPGVRVTWLARGHAEVGTLLVPAVREHVGLPVAPAGGAASGPVDPDLWETPRHSSAGEPLDVPAAGQALADTRAWIAGESAMVTRLRRALVRELGVDRHRVAFMGYWRRGVAMRS